MLEHGRGLNDTLLVYINFRVKDGIDNIVEHKSLVYIEFEKFQILNMTNKLK